MKRFELILIQIFAAIGSYLIVSMPFAFGFEVSIFTYDMQEFTTSIADFTQLVKKEFSYPYKMNIQYLKITLSGKDPGKTIKKVYLYRCKDYSPVQCLQNGILPVISVSPFNATIWFNDETRWGDVQRNGVANFLTLVKMDVGGKEVWTGSWDIIEETGVGQFTPRNYDLDKLNVYLKSGVQGTTVKNYIESYLNIPTNWVDHSVLTLVEGSSVNKLYELTGNKDEIDPSGTGTPDFYAGILTGNSFNGSSKEWAFIFGGDGKTSNPVAFYSTGGAAPIVSGVKLKIDNWNPQTVTCGSSEVIQVTSHVENASALNCGEADCYFQDYHYTIDGVQSSPGDITCSIINPSESIYKYQCSVPVNKFPVCSAPKTSTLALYFQYKNDVLLSAEFPVTLQQPPASLIVNSVIPSIFDCGIDTELTANLGVTNPPGGTPSKYYTFDGTNFNSMSCTSSGGTFVCKIPEDEICSLLQEDLDITFKFEYPEVDVTSDPVNIRVTFPPPSLGIDTVTPEIFMAGEKTSAEVLLHVNYPDSISYSESDFKYKYLDKSFQSATCSLHNSFSNIKYYKCSIELDIPSGKEGVETLGLRLDAYQGGQLKSLLANYFITIKSPPPQPSLTIVSTSSPLDCIKDSSLTVQAKAENIQGNPTKTEYSVDGGQKFESLTCSGSGNVYTCYIPKGNLCPLLTNSLDLILKFTYGTTNLVSNSQRIYINIPEPHMQVYSVFPDTLPIGKTSQTTVNLYIQYPASVSSPKFTYSYLDKADQSMSCQKVSSTSTRDYYRCSSTTFTIPSDYSGNQILVVFAIEGTTLNYPYNIKVTSEGIGIEPWFEIYSTMPGKIEVEVGNSTQAALSLTVHNALENNLKHSATLQPTKWITSGTCQETDIDYDFSCDVKVSAPKDALIGENKADVSIRVSDGKTYTLTNQTKVYVLPGEFYLDIQSITPDKLYCQGHRQSNPQEIKVNAKLMNIQADSLLQEKIIFNDGEIVHSARYCTLQGNSITCNIPTDKLLEKVTCGQGELAPGEGLHYYTLSLSVLLKKGDEQIQVSGSKDLGVEAIPLQAYLEIIDEDVEQGYLRESINCLGSKTIKLGDGAGYVRIKYADLLHQTPDESDLTWSFRLDAYDERGKLTKGMGVSPTANATICKMKRSQQVGVHRYEDYQCTLFVDRKMFQRCADGEGTLALTVMSKTMGRSAEGEMKVYINLGDEDFDLYVQVEKDATNEITCWITTFDGRCHLEFSQLNTTISIKNRGQGDIGDLKLFDSDVQFKGDGDVETDVYSPYCRETTSGSRKYICGFGVRPAITIEEKVTNATDQTFKDVDLGTLEFTALVKYADNLAEDSLETDVGSVTVKPKKDPAFIDYLQQKEKIKGVIKTVKDIMKWVLRIAGFCVTCAAGTWIYREIAGDGGNTTGGGTNGGGTNGGGGTSYYNQPCVGKTSGLAGTCKYYCLDGTSEDAKANGCGEVTGLVCCTPKSWFSGSGSVYEPEGGKISFSPNILDDCINCVKEGKTWCHGSNTCISSSETCSYYPRTTETECKISYWDEVKPRCPGPCVPFSTDCAEGTDPIYGKYACPDSPGNGWRLWCCEYVRIEGEEYTVESEDPVCSAQHGSCNNCIDKGCSYCLKDFKCYRDASSCSGTTAKNNMDCLGQYAFNVPSPDMDYLNQINKMTKEAAAKGKGAKNWWEAVGAIIVFGALFVGAVFLLSGKIEGEGTNEYTSALAQGMKWGLICIILQALGGWLKGEEGKGSQFAETLGKGMTATGDFLYKACVFLAKAFPALIALLSIIMRWITFQMCIEDIERSLDQGYYGGTGAQAYRSGLTGTQSALSRLQSCLNQFTEISKDAYMIGQTMYYSGVGLWGSTSFKLYETKPSEREITGTAQICEGEYVKFKAENWCKAIMDKGTDSQYIKITSSSGNSCTSVTIQSAEYCRGQYGYGYGYGWGAGGYTPMYQAPGTSTGSFIPVNQCPGDKKENSYEYQLSIPGTGQYFTLNYKQAC